MKLIQVPVIILLFALSMPLMATQELINAVRLATQGKTIKELQNENEKCLKNIADFTGKVNQHFMQRMIITQRVIEQELDKRTKEKDTKDNMQEHKKSVQE